MYFEFDHLHSNYLLEELLDGSEADIFGVYCSVGGIEPHMYFSSLSAERIINGETKIASENWSQLALP